MAGVNTVTDPETSPASLRTERGRRKAVSRSLPISVRVGIGAILAGMAAALGLLGWELLGYAAAPTALWLIAVLLLLWKRPRLLRRTPTLWPALVIAIVAVAGALSLYQQEAGGPLGELVAGAARLEGVLRVAPLFLLALVVAVPRRSWRASRKTSVWGTRLVRAGSRYAAEGLRAVARGTKAGLLLTGRSVTRLVHGYRRSPWHRPVLRLLGAGVGGLTGVWSLLLRRVRDRRDRRQQEGLAALPAASSGLQFLEEAPPLEEDEEAASPQEGIADAAEALVPVLEVSSPPLAAGASGWSLPPRELLETGEQIPFLDEENRKKAGLIEETLADYGIEVTVGEIRPGPVVTQFGLVPGWVRRYRETPKRDDEGRTVRDEAGRPARVRTEERTRVKVDNILSREKDLALALAARSIRFEAPVPGESFVGLEVPNAQPQVVTLRSVLESDAFQTMRRKGRLPLALGQGSGGEPVVADLAEMPHLLIAGATGSGKSVCINTILCSLLMQFTPLEVRLFLVDPKRVELTVYNDIPHLLDPVLVDPDKVVPALRGLIGEMNRRYQRFEQARVRNIETYNRKIESPESRLPYMVFVVDELADLMMTASADVEQGLCRLAQLGRATGIHLVLATQRPSVDVLTGLIKANFPSRISFAVASQVDSRTVLDGAGAEKLLGQGDMLFLPTNYIKPKRLQGTFIADDEVQALVTHWSKARGEAPPILLAQESAQEGEEGDELLRRAKELARSHKRISASLLQRKLGTGYARASGLLDRLEELGMVEEGDPGTSRTVIRGME